MLSLRHFIWQEKIFTQVNAHFDLRSGELVSSGSVRITRKQSDLKACWINSNVENENLKDKNKNLIIFSLMMY